MNFYQTYRYECIAAVNGAIIMVLELVGARMVAPYFGSSIYVWTAVIGVVLGALSLGYWQGGRLADQSATDRQLGLFMTLASLILLVTMLAHELLIAFATALGSDIRTETFIAAVLLFAPVNIFMGMVAPFVAKLKITSLAVTGQFVGSLNAAATIGSLIGTFATGYWLIALFGNRALGLLLVAGLLGNSFLVTRREFIWQRVVLLLIVIALVVQPGHLTLSSPGSKIVYDGDSAYSRLQVIDVPRAGQTLRILRMDNLASQSGVYLENRTDPPFDYIQRFLDVAEAHESPRRILLIGGGAYTFPQLLIDRLADVQIDVVEIDPKLDKIAEDWFGYKPDPRVRIIHEDGRMFLNQNKTKYDLIYVDAFSSMSPPFQLTTSEAVSRIQESLTSTGLVVVNIINAYQGPGAAFTLAELATYQKWFPSVAVAPATRDIAPAERQNLILVAAGEPSLTTRAVSRFPIPPFPEVKPDSRLILTDDFAPVEQFVARTGS